MNMSVTSKMSINCGMQGMHGNSVKKVAEQDMSKINSVANKQSIPTECGMKNMHQNSSINPVQAANISDSIPNIGTSIDAKG